MGKILNVSAELTRIERMANDPELAHRAEKLLWEKALVLIAAGAIKNPETLARQVLETRSFQFPRWFS